MTNDIKPKRKDFSSWYPINPTIRNISPTKKELFKIFLSNI